MLAARAVAAKAKSEKAALILTLWGGLYINSDW